MYVAFYKMGFSILADNCADVKHTHTHTPMLQSSAIQGNTVHVKTEFKRLILVK